MKFPLKGDPCLVVWVDYVLNNYFILDRPFYTVVTYLPRYEDNSNAAKIFRILFYLLWMGMMPAMLSIDCLPIVHLIAIAYKFKTLCRHYKRIREEFDKDLLTMPKERAIVKWRAGYLDGIKMHQKLML